ncbi:MAG: MATE family efflux transporter [Bacilli bacterium]
MSSYDFTKGSINKKLTMFMLPILLSLFLQQLYGAVDVWVVGNFSTSADLSAVSNGYQFISIFINFVAGLSVGTTIILGNKIGAKDTFDLGKVIGASIYIFLLVSLIFTFSIGLNGDLFAGLINAPTEAFDKTSSYISILGYGSLFLVSYNILGAIFRGLGDSKTPLFAVAVATVVNIGLDLLFVKGFGLGAYGASIATVIAQGVSVIFSLIVIFKRKTNFTFKMSYIRYSKKYTKSIIALGMPLALNSFLVTLSFTFVLRITNGLGVNVSAGVGVTERLIGFLMLIPMAFGSAMGAFTAQNVGASLHDRAKKGLYFSLICSISIALIVAVFTLLFGQNMLRIFSDDAAVIEPGYEYLKAYCFDIFFTAILFNALGYFNGYSKTAFTMVNGIIGAFAFRVPLSYLFSLITPVSIFLIGLATPSGTLFQIILCIIWYILLQKKLKKEKGKITPNKIGL